MQRCHFQRIYGSPHDLVIMNYYLPVKTQTQMKLLTKLLIAFSEETTAANVSAENMSIRTNFGVLDAAIGKVTTADGTST